MKKIFQILTIIILIQSCKSNDEIDLTGQWRLVKSVEENIIQPFKSYCPTSYPEYYPCEEILYITKYKIEHPLFGDRQGFEISDKFIEYELNNGRIKFVRYSEEYEYNYNYSKDKICFDEGKLCLEKIIRNSPELDSTILKFKVIDEFSTPYTIWLNHYYMQEKSTCEIRYHRNCKEDETVQVDMPKDEINYILNLLERIPDESLNKIYNNGLSDCREISIDFYTNKNKWQGIETCNLTDENTFEIRALTTNMFWIINKYLKKE